MPKWLGRDLIAELIRRMKLKFSFLLKFFLKRRSSVFATFNDSRFAQSQSFGGSSSLFIVNLRFFSLLSDTLKVGIICEMMYE